MINKKKIGDRLVKLRGDRSQEEVSRKLKISTSALRKYESGDRTPRDELKVKIAKFYGSSIQEIFFD